MGSDRAIARKLLTGMLALTVVACASGGDTVRGIVVSVDGDLSTVTAFDVRAEGEIIHFTPAPDGDFEFELVHLRDHLRAGEPVVVGFEVLGDGSRLATSISDG